MARHNINSHRVPFALFPEHARLRQRLLDLAEPSTVSKCLVVPAVTGAGKTAMLHWLGALSNPAIVRGRVGLFGVESLLWSIYAAVCPDASDADISGESAVHERTSNEDRLELIVEGIRSQGVELIALDDCDSLLHKSNLPAVVRSCAGLLRTLGRRCSVRFALFGGLDVIGFTELQLAGGTERIGIGPIGDSVVYRDWLDNLQAVHDETKDRQERLSDDQIARLLLSLGRGFVGFIEQDARDALDDNELWKLRFGDAIRPASLIDRILQPKEEGRFGGQGLIDSVARDWEIANHA